MHANKNTTAAYPPMFVDISIHIKPGLVIQAQDPVRELMEKKQMEEFKMNLMIMLGYPLENLRKEPSMRNVDIKIYDGDAKTY